MYYRRKRRSSGSNRLNESAYEDKRIDSVDHIDVGCDYLIHVADIGDEMIGKCVAVGDLQNHLEYVHKASNIHCEIAIFTDLYYPDQIVIISQDMVHRGEVEIYEEE